MLSVDLTGNFGDHMIRYALCRTVAERNGYLWGINPVPSHDYYGGREQMFFFDIDYGLPVDTPYGQLPPGIAGIWEEQTEHFPTHAFHPFQPDIFEVPDWTKLVVYCGQDARYYDKKKLKKWFEFKEEYQNQSEQTLKDCGIELDEDLTVINCRGGEYTRIPALFLQKDYWNNAIRHMRLRNPHMRFIVITEDPYFYRNYFDFPVYHLGICGDYYAVNHAHNLILSNSGFALFPAFLNEQVQNVIAPRFWSRHNISTGYWGNADIWTFGEGKWKWMDRDGGVYEK